MAAFFHMLRKGQLFVLFLSCLFSLSALNALELQGRLNDYAALLSQAEKSELEEKLANFEKAHGIQLVVVTVKSLEGKTIEDFGYELGRQWGIGTKGKNDGILLIIAPLERKVRIEVGYGLEGTLTDAESKLIIERYILPFFRRGEMGAGIIKGSQAIMATFGEEGAPLDSGNEEEGDLDWLIIFFILWIFLIIFFGIRGSGRGPGSRSGPPPFGGQGSDSRSDGFSGRGGSYGGGGASGGW